MPENPLDPGPDTERRIQERAYYLWESEGRPTGREQDYWERARELQAMHDSKAAGELPNPMIAHPDPADEQTIEEASLQENLGEFPHAGLSDQGDRNETPMARKSARGGRKK